MLDALTFTVPPLDLAKILKAKSHEIADDDCVNNWVAYIDDMANNLDINLLRALAKDLDLLRISHERIKSEQDRHDWFRRTFSFLHNHLGQLSPRLFIYFHQCELLAFGRTMYWYDQLSETDKFLVGEKLMEIINKTDTPRRAEFFTLLPYRLKTQVSKIELDAMTPIVSSCSARSLP